jgi:hypothetical protein
MLFWHEIGHGFAAIATGGEVISTNLDPGQFGHTFVDPNPRPGWVLWGGFLSGCLIPAAFALAVPRSATRLHLEAGWIASFCGLTNGVYLAVGGSERLTDTGQLLQLGWPIAAMIAIGVPLAIAGYLGCRHSAIALWNELTFHPLRRTDLVIRWSLLVGWIIAQAFLARAIDHTIAPPPLPTPPRSTNTP